ncbi:hypothetical protein OCH239_13075 [Roseivivax halodurans JCM 10272]|uniref:SMODS and SLOG-associating 2TM effector domain-containing protein n=1 Tax=Roseivivax halodurans JCM 10272 TaxID=1449350 RepID=X7EBB1_9RHOB|nr:hypothetical protein [Roseivivax halodurans]ETX13160.1 hypothetical protein OCH239_13075 [Roseivivax halodurans JCM 10272]
MSKPNSDLGLNEGDETYLRNQYPKIADHLIWPELQAEFLDHEVAAKSLKTGSRRRSFLAIALITLSLLATLIATSSPLEVFIAADSALAKGLIATSVILLVVALLLGKGILFGRKRDDWLTHRLISERVRQFYFQFLLAHLEEICSTSVLDRQRVLEGRAKSLERVLRRVRAGAYRQTVRDDTTLNEALMIDIPDSQRGNLDSERYAEIKRFWEELRFNWQAEYSTSTLDRKATPFPLFGSLADQEHTVKTLEFIATLGIVTFQMLAVSSQLLLSSSSDQSQLFVLGSSLLAICVVGLQSYKDGTGLTEDLLRNRAYATYCSKLTRDFKMAELKDDRFAEIHAMREMETLAYFETREFLNTHSRAQFSL